MRGSILDVFPATADAPVRIDLWGDEVERLCEFSVADQRATVDLDSVQIVGARELLPSPEVRERAERLVATQPWGREQWQRLADGEVFEGMEAWLAWLADREHVLFDLVPDDAQIVWSIRVVCATVPPTSQRRKPTGRLAGAHLGTLTRSGRRPGRAAPSARRLRPTVGPHRRTGLDHAHRARFARQPHGRSAGLAPGRSATRRPWSPSCARSSTTATRCWPVPTLRPRRRGSKRCCPSRASRSPSWPREQPRRLLSCAVAVGASWSPRSTAARSSRRPAGAARRGRPERPAPHPPPATHPTPRCQRFFEDLKVGDHVVHQVHGVGRFDGMVTRAMGGVERDYLLLEYRGGDKLYVPSDQIDSIRLYSGGETPKLNKMGGADFSRTKAKVRSAVAEIAQELVVLYQRRAGDAGPLLRSRYAVAARHGALVPLPGDPDQLSAIEAVKGDMESPVPMDRLVCGDVGFGKTEVALRAAFKAVQDGRQVAVLVPTTLLAQQHHQTFSERFAGFPVRVEVLSRFLTAAQARKVAEGVTSGEVDVVIGTHRLLSADIEFKNLGLLVVDEEQRFGVSHKESIKKFRAEVDVLTLSATPIPRTLEMSLTGIRDLSLLNTPPAARQPILTYVGEFDERAVTEAIRRELLREGQVFYVHNRVRDIEQQAARLGELVPEARIAVAHGQMDEGTLERVVVDFWEGNYDVLVCTTIIESGIDMPTVNTLVVERADLLGLGQLHQLRGRVGRAGQRAYAYLFYPQDRQLSEEAYERLKTIGEATELGSGFRIAMRDLEIRGAATCWAPGSPATWRRWATTCTARWSTRPSPSSTARRPRSPTRSCSSCPCRRTCRPTTSNATTCVWTPTDGSPPCAPTPTSTTSRPSGSTGSARCRHRRGVAGGGARARRMRPHRRARRHRDQEPRAVGRRVAGHAVADHAPAVPPDAPGAPLQGRHLPCRTARAAPARSWRRRTGGTARRGAHRTGARPRT